MWPAVVKRAPLQDMITYTKDNVDKDGMQVPHEKWDPSKQAKKGGGCEIM
jgi:hypothetical protein